MLSHLERRGLIEKILGKPLKIKPVPIDLALSLLINHEQAIAKERVSALRAKKRTFLTEFNLHQIEPEFDSEQDHLIIS